MRYISGETAHPIEQDYAIEDGVYVTPEPAKTRLRDRWEAAERTAFVPQNIRKVEEARWAARSGPCVVIRRAREE